MTNALSVVVGAAVRLAVFWAASIGRARSAQALVARRRRCSSR